MILTDSSAARVGANVVRAIASASAALRQFMVYTDLTLSGALSGAIELIKNGPGTLTLSASNTYTGATRVNSGTLATSTANRIPDASAVIIASGAALTLGGADTLATLAGAGTLTCGANALTLNSANSAIFSGTLTNTAGTFIKTGSGVQTLSGSTTVAAQVRLDGGGIVSSGCTGST